MAIDVTDIPPSVQEQHGLAFCGKSGELPRLLAESDYLSVHVPLTTATRHMLGGAALSAMKPSAVIINVARGEIIDEAALVEALQSGRIRGAGLDVFPQEPVDPESPVVATAQCCGHSSCRWRDLRDLVSSSTSRNRERGACGSRPSSPVSSNQRRVTALPLSPIVDLVAKLEDWRKTPLLG